MLKIIDNNIHLTRGDSAEIQLNITVGEETEYTFGTGDSCILTVKNNVNEEEALFVKELGENNIFEIEPSDTEDLKYGKYKYDIQLTLANGKVYTVIPPYDFIVEAEVSF